MASKPAELRKVPSTGDNKVLSIEKTNESKDQTQKFDDNEQVQ